MRIFGVIPFIKLKKKEKKEVKNNNKTKNNYKKYIYI